MFPLHMIAQLPGPWGAIIITTALAIAIGGAIFFPPKQEPDLERINFMRECIVKMPGWRCREIWYYTREE